MFICNILFLLGTDNKTTDIYYYLRHFCIGGHCFRDVFVVTFLLRQFDVTPPFVLHFQQLVIKVERFIKI